VTAGGRDVDDPLGALRPHRRQDELISLPVDGFTGFAG